MGKFSPIKVTEYNFISLEEMICDIIQEFKDNSENKDFGIGIVLTSNDVPKFVTALLSTDRFMPEWLEYDSYDYCNEYLISLYKDGGFELLKSWSETYEKYYPVDSEIHTIVFVSQDIFKQNKQYFDVINDGKNNIVLFNIED